jgi:hypothetical protein
MPEKSFAEQLWNGLGDAIADVREKFVEEPWFGRVVTERGEPMPWPQAVEAEPQPTGLTGEVLGPEREPTQTPGNAPALEHGYVLHQPAREDTSPQWPQAREQQQLGESVSERENRQDHEPTRDMDIDR